MRKVVGPTNFDRGMDSSAEKDERAEGHEMVLGLRALHVQVVRRELRRRDGQRRVQRRNVRVRIQIACFH